MVMSTGLPQGTRVNPRFTLEVTPGMSIANAIANADALGGDWTILLYPGTYNEGDLAPTGGANITIQGMGEERPVIAPTAAPAAGVIVSGHTLTLVGVTVTAPTAVFPPIRVTGGTLTMRDCDINGFVAGVAIQQVGGRMDIYHSNIAVGNIDLSTGACNFNIYHSPIYGGVTVAAEALAHTMWFDTCYFHNLDIQSLATGATTCTVTNSTYLDQITNAGTGAFTINGTSVSRINQTNATGTTTVYGGYVWQVTRAVGSVIWWLDDTTLKVIPSQTATDRVIQWAVNAADAATGQIIILVHAGTYNEGEITPAGTADITIKGMGEGRVQIVPTAIPATGTFVSGHTLCLENLTITAFSNARTAITVNGGTLTIETCFISGITTGDAIAMIAGQINAYRTRVLLGDIDLSTDDCILNMYFCQIVTDPIDTAGNLAHQIWLEHCNLNNQGVASAATGATTVRTYGCSHLGLLANAGTGNWECRLSDVGGVNFTGTGTLTLFGGDLGSITRAAASVVWWLNGSIIKVLPSATITDGMIGYALAAAAAGGITIRLAAGRYQEDNLALVDGVTIAGEGHETVEIYEDSANPIFTAGANVVNRLRGLKIHQDGAGECLQITGAGAEIHCDNVDFDSAGTHALEMTNGSFSAHLSDFQNGDIYLATSACTLTIDYCRIAATSGIDTDATAVDHTISCEHCDFNGSSITIDSTGAGSTVALTLRYCSDINAFTDASFAGTVDIEQCMIVTATKSGTSPWTVRIASIGILSNTNATGAITAYAGILLAYARAQGPIVWWWDSNTLKVIPCTTTTDTIIGWAVAATGIAAGDTVVIHPGTYQEVVTLAAGINLQGIDKDNCILNGTAVTLITMAAGCRVSGLTLNATASGGNAIGIECNDQAFIIENVDINLVRVNNNAYAIHENVGATARVIILKNLRILSDTDTNEAGIYIQQAGKTFYVEESFIQGGDYAIRCAVASTFYVSHSHLEVNVVPPGGGTTISCLAATMHFRDCTILKQISAGNLGIIRLLNCSYRQINRTGTGNIVDESPQLQDAPWHVEKWTWQAALANAQVAVRGTPIDAGSGQVQLEVTDDTADQEAVEALPAVAGALAVSVLPARTPRCLMQVAHDAFDAHTTAFYGLRHTLGNDIPDIAAEECAGFDWNGTNFRAISSDGATGQATDLTEPSVDTQIQLEVIVFGSVRVEFYVDGILVATHDTLPDGVPDATLDWQHLLETAGGDGAHVVQATIRNGGVQECPA